MGRRATQYPDGVSVEGDRIIIRFSWKGDRCREIYNFQNTPKNIARAGDLVRDIKHRIRFNTFTLDDYKRFFPTSKRIAEMGTPDMFGALAQDWLNAVEVGPATRDEYRRALNRYWMPLYAARPIGSIPYSELRRDVNAIDWPSNKTRNNALIPLRGVFEAAYIDELIDRNPADRLRNIKHQKPPVDPFTSDEADRIIDAMYRLFTGRDAIHAAFVEWQFYTGMRSSEALALRWSDIDFTKHYARVQKAQSKGRLNEQTKTAKVRDVALNSRALHALQAAKGLTFLAGGAVFEPHDPNAGYEPGDGFKTEKSQRKQFTQVLKKLGIRHRPLKNCRHTYATMLLMAGANVTFVANQLGHSVVMTTTIYGKWMTGKEDAAELAKLKMAAG